MLLVVGAEDLRGLEGKAGLERQGRRHCPNVSDKGLAPDLLDPGMADGQRGLNLHAAHRLVEDIERCLAKIECALAAELDGVGLARPPGPDRPADPLATGGPAQLGAGRIGRRCGIEVEQVRLIHGVGRDQADQLG